MSNLGWECPVCHCGNAPTASFCWNCVQQRTKADPDSGPPVSLEEWERLARLARKNIQGRE